MMGGEGHTSSEFPKAWDWCLQIWCLCYTNRVLASTPANNKFG
jgi:hypothetical protein